jgi:multiple sugar transport system permease protein
MAEATKEKVDKAAKEGTKVKFEKYNRFGYYFLIPFFLIFLIFQLYPIIYTFMISFTNMAGFNSFADSSFVGFGNFKQVLGDSLFQSALGNTLLLWIINIVPQMGFALLLASWWSNTHLNLKFTKFFKVVFYLPNMIMAASVAGLFYNLFSVSGPINQILISTGIIGKAFNFFQSEWGTRGLISFIQFWMWYGQTAIVLVAGILSIDESLFEAARMDGANDGTIFRKITLPLLKPILMYTLVTSFVGGLQVFDIPYLINRGQISNGNRTLATYIYNMAFTGDQNFGISAAASIVLLIVAAIVSIFMFGTFRDRASNALGGK